MTQIHWANAVDGKFTTAADWSGGVAPGAQDDAILDAAGPRFIVTSAVNETVNSLQLAANATFSIIGGTFSALTGTGAGVNAGTIELGDRANFAVGGAVDNAGAIIVGGIGDPTRLIIAADTTLSGGGTVTLGDYAQDQIVAASGAKVVLVNKDDVIAGGGGIGASGGKLTIRNSPYGVIDASQTMTIGSATRTGSLHNDGLIEATVTVYSPTLTIQNMIITGKHGRIIDGSGSYLSFVSCTVSGQTLATASGAQMFFSGSGTVTLGARLINLGDMYFGETAPLVLTRDLTLVGRGSVNMENGVTGDGASVVLDNRNNYLRLNGAFGGNGLSLVNEAGGVVIGDNFGAPCVIDTGRNAVVNAGLIETFGRGTLEMDSDLANSGTVNANGLAITLDGAVANSGTLMTEDGLVIVNGAVTGDGVGVVDEGVLQFTSSFNQNVTFKASAQATGTLILAHSQAYTGQISGFSGGDRTFLDLRDIKAVNGEQPSFSGTTTSGVLTVTDGTHVASITLIGDYLGSPFYGYDDGHGGIIVIYDAGNPQLPITPPPSTSHLFIAAMASLAATSGTLQAGDGERMLRPTLLSAPKPALA